MSRFGGLWIVCLWLGAAACSGQGQTAEPEAPPVTDEPSPPAELPAAASPTPSASDPAPAPAAADPLAALISTVLDSRPMVMYLHPEVEGRVPVAIFGPALEGRTIDAQAQGAPIRQPTLEEVDADPEAPVVFFERISITDERAEVRLRYPIEGIVGRFELVSADGSWSITKAELVEQ